MSLPRTSFALFLATPIALALVLGVALGGESTGTAAHGGPGARSVGVSDDSALDATAATALKKGDTNCDGEINGLDVLPYLVYWAGTGNRPTLCEGPAPVALPQGENAPYFNAAVMGSGYIEIPYSAELNPTGAITVEALVNPFSYENRDGDTCSSLVGNGYPTAYWLGLCRGRVRFYSRGSTGRVDSAGLVPLRQWSRVSVVADATSVKFYINGALDSDIGGFSGDLTTNTNPVHIGGDPDYDVRPWAAIDDVRIWNVARTEQEIDSNKQLQGVAPAAGLVAEWTFNLFTFDDATGNHDGQAVGDVLITSVDSTLFNWVDLNCDGFVDIDDALVVLYGATGLTFPGLPGFCETIGAAIPPS